MSKKIIVDNNLVGVLYEMDNIIFYDDYITNDMEVVMEQKSFSEAINQIASYLETYFSRSKLVKCVF